MGQMEIIQYLKDLRLNGDNKFYTIKEISLNVHNGNINKTINKLYAWGYLDIDVTYWPLPIVRRFRLKDKYLLQGTDCISEQI